MKQTDNKLITKSGIYRLPSTFCPIPGLNRFSIRVVLNKRLLLQISFLFFYSLLNAQGGSFSLSPQSIELEVSPGARKQIKILVMNEDMVKPRRIRYFPADFVERPSGIYQVVDKADSNFSAKNWLKLDTGEIFLKKGEAKEVIVDLIIPYGVKGGRYCAIVFESVPDVLAEGYQVAWRMQVPVFIELTIKSLHKPTKKAIITNMEVTEAKNVAKFRDKGVKEDAIVITAKVKNQGDIHIKGLGRVIIRDKQGNRIRENPLGGGEGVVLPNTEVDFISVIPRPKPGEYIAEAIIYYGTHSPAIGRIPFKVLAKVTRLTGTFQGTTPTMVTVNKEFLEIQMASKSFRNEILIFQNEESEMVQINSEIKAAMNGPDGAILPSDSNSERWCAKDWVQVEPKEFILEPGKAKQVKVNISVPALEPGGKYATLVFRIKKEKALSEVSTEIYVPILITIRGVTQKGVEITRILTRDNPPAFAVVVKNTGDVHLKLKGHLTILEPLVEKPIQEEDFRPLSEVALKEDNVIILPNEMVRLIGKSDKRLKPRKYFAKVILNYGERLPFIETKEIFVR